MYNKWKILDKTCLNFDKIMKNCRIVQKIVLNLSIFYY